MSYSLEEMADWIEIHDMITRYVHALDDRQWDVLDTVFMPETIFDLTSAGAMRATWTEVKPYYIQQRKVFVRYFHLFGNLRIAFDPERKSARLKSKVINPVGVTDETGALRLFQIQGEYDDKLVKTTAGWRVAERTWIHGWISGDYPFSEGPGELRQNA